MRKPRSGAGASWQHLYKTGRWQKVRRIHLSGEPLCRMCAALGHVEAATVVDHVKPHKGDEALFWNTGNLQSLCKACHDRHKQSEDRTGRAKPVIGLDGWPIVQCN